MLSVPFFTRVRIGMQRLVRWEFWPWQVVYLPVAIYWFFLAIKAKGWVFFSAANPCMRFGGLVAYSKAEVIKLVPVSHLPRTIFLDTDSQPPEILAELKRMQMSLPLIIKPDMGERGKGVRILRTEQELSNALSVIKEPMLLQVYEDLPLELGVMYSRHPNEPKGKITSVVVKDFPTVVGDGKRTLADLILSDLRTRLSYKIHFRRFAERLNEVPSDGEKIQIVTIGNHMLGTTFYDGNHLISQQLEQVFDELAKRMEGFHIGRFDLRTASLEELNRGVFKVIEVNGVNSEPCHIYDPKMPLWKGLRDLLRHWERIYQISVANHRNGVPYASFLEIRREIRRHNREGAKHD